MGKMGGDVRLRPVFRGVIRKVCPSRHFAMPAGAVPAGFHLAANPLL